MRPFEPTEESPMFPERTVSVDGGEIKSNCRGKTDRTFFEHSLLAEVSHDVIFASS